MNKTSKSFFVFDFIAPVYGLFFNYQKKTFQSVIDHVYNELGLSAYQDILDVGCGTGALCAVLRLKGHMVTGIDPVQRMLRIAKKKKENKGISFISANILEGLPFAHKSFDVCIASYVAHGLNAKERKIMYTEMSRVTKQRVVFYEYNENRSIITNIIEWFEGGDYFNFIKNVKRELEENFRDVKIIDVGKRAALYICDPDIGESIAD